MRATTLMKRRLDAETRHFRDGLAIQERLLALAEGDAKPYCLRIYGEGTTQ
jgi:hypothetical protein